MKDAWLPYLSRSVPRYTSYPTALQFTPNVAAPAQMQRLGNIGLYEPLSLYIHVPFCASLCHYCGCNMRVCNDYARARTYVDHLLEEMALVSSAMQGCGRVVNVHFGGGTPNYLKSEDLGRILDGIERHFGLTDETSVAMEIDPRQMSYQDAEDMSRMGVSRVSLGVQDFHPDVQRAIGRVQPASMVAEITAAFRAVGIFEVSFDMMYGLPHQTRETLLESLAQAADIRPDRIALFGYAHLPSRLAHQRLIPDDTLPGPDVRAAQVTAARTALQNHGYDMIGFDHFALPGNSLAQAAKQGRVRRNFQGFSDDPSNIIIGLGMSAISQFPDVITQNSKDLRSYYGSIEADKLPTVRGVRLSDQDQLRATIIEDLLCRLRCDVKARCSQYKVNASSLSREMDALEPLIDDGLVSVEDGVIRIPEAARVLARIVAHSFDAYKFDKSPISAAL